MNVYVASSWRNPWQPSVLRGWGHTVYDFRKPDGGTGFSWREVDPDWKEWKARAYRAGLAHPIAERGFASDMNALRACDACVLVQPTGNSAHLELGWAIGAGKRTAVLFPLDIIPADIDGHTPNDPYGCDVCIGPCELAARQSEPELMVKAADALLLGVYELRQWIGRAA